jgi:hypothetical protein
MGESTGEENTNLYTRGVNEGRSGELLDASELLDILDVFGEDSLRSYLMGVIEGKRTPPKTKTTRKTETSEKSRCFAQRPYSIPRRRLLFLNNAQSACSREKAKRPSVHLKRSFSSS